MRATQFFSEHRFRVQFKISDDRERYGQGMAVSLHLLLTTTRIDSHLRKVQLLFVVEFHLPNCYKSFFDISPTFLLPHDIGVVLS